MDDETRQWLAEGIAKARSGQREQAREVLLRVVERDERNVLAWLWLSDLVDNPQDRRVALENVLTIEPDNALARAGLDWLDQQALAQPPPASLPESEQDQPHPVPQAQPALSPTDASVLEAERCPFCGQPVAENAGRCPKCAQPLTIHAPRVREFPSRVGWLSTACVVQAVVAVFDIMLMLLTLQAMPITHKTLGTTFFSTYLVGAAFQSSPPTTALIRGVQFLFLFNGVAIAWLLTLAVILPARRPVAPFVALFVTAVQLVLALIGFVMGVSSLLIAVARAALALFVGLWLLESHGDFEWVTVRHRLELDGSARSSMDYYTQGRYYRRQGQTAKAILHFERAIELDSGRFDYRVALGNAYYAMGQYDRSAEQLRAALQINPRAPDVREFLELVTQRLSPSEERMV